MESPLLRLVRQMRRSPKCAALPVFVTSSVNEDAEISAGMSDGRIGPETLVVVIQKFAFENLADGLPAS